MPETITGRDAARFPIIASCTLFGLYLFFKVILDLLSPPAEATFIVQLHVCVCSDAGVFSRVHQPSTVRLLLRPGSPGLVPHYEVKTEI